MTVVCLLVGGQQIHQRNVLRQLGEFDAAGVAFGSYPNVRGAKRRGDWLWIRIPSVAWINIDLLPTNEFVLDHKSYRLKDAAHQVQLLGERLKEFGVSQTFTLVKQSASSITFEGYTSETFIKQVKWWEQYR